MSDAVNYPVGEQQDACALCNGPLEQVVTPLTDTYPNLVCWECEQQAVNMDGEEPKRGVEYREMLQKENSDNVNHPSDKGENPVFIDGQKCWRRYRFGGYITQYDQFDCDTHSEFHKTHFPD